MSRARSRPPKLEHQPGIAAPAPPSTPEVLLERSKVAGRAAAGPGAREFRRAVERLVAGDRAARGSFAPMTGLTAVEAWSAVADGFGATADAAVIDPHRTVTAVRAARRRVRAVARDGGRIAIATAHPASLLMVHLAFASVARTEGGEVSELADFGPLRADGRTGRWLRWVGGVALVTDGDALCATGDAAAAREWMFAIPRPALVVADGPFAEVAFEHGVEVVALAGLDRPAVAVAGRRGRCTLVPVHTDRPARAYAPIEALLHGPEPGAAADSTPDSTPDASPDSSPGAPAGEAEL